MAYQQQMKFLELSNERSEPFVIPNVSPVSSPNLFATGSPELATISKDLDKIEVSEKERKMSIIELN